MASNEEYVRKGLRMRDQHESKTISICTTWGSSVEVWGYRTRLTRPIREGPNEGGEHLDIGPVVGLVTQAPLHLLVQEVHHPLVRQG